MGNKHQKNCYCPKYIQIWQLFMNCFIQFFGGYDCLYSTLQNSKKKLKWNLNEIQMKF